LLFIDLDGLENIVMIKKIETIRYGSRFNNSLGLLF